MMLDLPKYKIRFIIHYSKTDSNNRRILPSAFINIPNKFKLHKYPSLEMVGRIYVERYEEVIVATGNLTEIDLDFFPLIRIDQVEESYVDENGNTIVTKCSVDSVVYLCERPNTNIWDDIAINKTIKQQLIDGEAINYGNEAGDILYLFNKPHKIKTFIHSWNPGHYEYIIQIKEVFQVKNNNLLIFHEKKAIEIDGIKEAINSVFCYGLRNHKMEVLLAAEYHHFTFEDSLIVAWGEVPYQSIFIYSNNKINFIYDFDDGYSPVFGMKPVKKNNKWGYISSLDGVLMVDCKYEQVYNFDKSGFSFVRLYNLVGLIDHEDNEILKCEYQSFHSVSNSQAIVNKGGFWGSIHIVTKQIGIPFIYDDVGIDLNQDMLLVLQKGKKGFVNTLTCAEQIACIYEDAIPFDKSTPIAKVLKNDEWFYINLSGKKINPMSL